MGEEEEKKKAGKKYCALNPSLGGGRSREGAGCSFKQVRRGITSQVPHSVCFTPQKGYVKKR